MVASIKEEIKLELQAEELRQIFIEQSGLNEAQKILDESSDTIKSMLAMTPDDSTDQHEFK